MSLCFNPLPWDSKVGVKETLYESEISLINWVYVKDKKSTNAKI